MLAMAWALYHFVAYEQAQDDYRRAIDQLDKMRGWYDSASAHVRSGGMLAAIDAQAARTDGGWTPLGVTLPPARTRWWIGDSTAVPREVPATFYLERLLLSNDFADALHDYRQLRQAADAVQADATAQDVSTLTASLAAALSAQQARLRDIALADLETQKAGIEKYLIEARFALATIYDRPQLAATP